MRDKNAGKGENGSIHSEVYSRVREPLPTTTEQRLDSRAVENYWFPTDTNLQVLQEQVENYKKEKYKR